VAYESWPGGREVTSPLSAIFAPKSVAVIGATEREGSVGRTILRNLITTAFGGVVYPVNEKRSSVLGIKSYATIRAVPEVVDLAVIVTPAPTVPTIIDECADLGIPGAIVISAGFKEIGADGLALEQQILVAARRGHMRIIGPNCLGVMNPLTGMNATFAASMARPGRVAFISQSGALCTAVLDWSIKEHVGFSAFVSVGSMLDVGWGDLISYLGNEPHTQSILIYMETIGDARSFLSAAREVALAKPIIVIKPGRTAAAAKAAASHTGSMTGSDEVLGAAFRRSGVLRVDNIADLFYMAEVLSKQPAPKGPRLTILTNAGGPGVLAADALLLGGGQLADMAPETTHQLDQILPTHWSHNNPIDILGDAGPDRYARALDIAANDPNSDGLLVVLTPQAMTDPRSIADTLKPYAQTTGKPLLASWMGGSEVAAGEQILNEANIPTFPYPDTAARVFNYMWQYSQNLRSLYETPLLAERADGGPDRARVSELIRAARASGRAVLTEFESKQLLAAYDIPTVATHIAHDADAAVALADSIGYPVVLKLHSETITHKTDVGGVQLSIRNANAVRQAYRSIEAAVTERAGGEHFLGVTVQPMVSRDGYEIILGSSPDPQFGPVLLFGSGGQLVEVYRDRALALPPLTTTLARRMMERTRIYTALQGVRGRPPVDLAELERVIVRFSQLVVEQPWIAEIDINPLLVSHEQLIALDARVVLHGPDVTDAELPKLAIRPYPTRYVSTWSMKDGTAVTIRPIRPEDEPLIVNFHATLSERSVYLRYFRMLRLDQRVAHERLTHICFIDYDRELALVAERRDEQTGERVILGVGRLSKVHGTSTGEFAILVSDNAQGKGLGSELLRRLVQCARDEGLEHLSADIMEENIEMQRVAKKLGFHVRHSLEDHTARAELSLL
jgi:acetyltransferase